MLVVLVFLYSTPLEQDTLKTVANQRGPMKQAVKKNTQTRQTNNTDLLLKLKKVIIAKWA